MLMFAYSLIRHKWRQVPSRCSCLRARFLIRAQLVDVLRIHVVRDVNVHSDVEEHG
jgi:hypothetical protein